MAEPDRSPRRFPHRNSRRPAGWLPWLGKAFGKQWARLSYAHFVEPIWLETNRIDLPMPKVDQRLDGLRILHLSDFHLSRRMPLSHLRAAVESANRQQCHLAALTGDFVQSGPKHVAEICQLVGRLQAPLGIYAVLGNHDYAIHNALGRRRWPDLWRTVTAELRAAGVAVLHNEARRLDFRGAEFAVAGVADQWSGDCDWAAALDGLPTELPRVALAHNPASALHLGQRRCDAVLSGHTHGGQVDVPGVGRPTLISRKLRRFAAGLYPLPGGGHLYVNKGVGYTLRFRYRVRPEIAVLTLRAS